MSLQNRERGGVRGDPGGCLDVKAYVRHRHGPQRVAVPEGQNLGAMGLGQSQEGERPGIDLRRRLPVRATVPKEIPAWPLGPDFGAGLALVIAVVELPEKICDGGLREARQLGGATGADQRAGVDGVEGDDGQVPAQVPRLVLPTLGQRQVRPPGVPAAQAPVGLAVPSQIETVQRPSSSGRPERRLRPAASITAPARRRSPWCTQTRPTAAR